MTVPAVHSTPEASPRSPSETLERTLPSEAYLSQDAFDVERERIFSAEWLCVGREELVPSPGDYLLVEAAGESVIVVRTRDRAFRAYYNVCRHRGSRLVLDDPPSDASPGPSGRFKGAIRCPYHAWTYALTGELRNAPFLSEDRGLRREHLPLHPASVDTWGGFVFLHLTPDAASSLAEQLGPVPKRLARYPLGTLRIATRITYDVRANWKCIVENYSECYHCGPVHPELCEIVPAFKEAGGQNLDWDRGIPHRDGATTYTFTGTTTREPFPGLAEEERTRHKAELIYPNLMMSLAPDHVVAFTLWPLGPDRTMIDCDFLFLQSEMERSGFDPSDAVEFWDLVNRQDWRICQSVQRGMASRVFRYGYYAPMEDQSLDIRRYLKERLGDVSTA